MPREMNAWLIIEPDDSIIIRYPRSEMGQGSFTALPMMVADELEADWSKVRAEFASANRNLREDMVYGKDMSSVGSHSVKDGRIQQQQVGASARVRLVMAAAQPDQPRHPLPAITVGDHLQAVMHDLHAFPVRVDQHREVGREHPRQPVERRRVGAHPRARDPRLDPADVVGELELALRR